MKWTKKEIDPALVREIARRYQIDTLAASIFVRRNITEPEQLRFYLEDGLQLLHNPFLFASMEDAIDRILMAHDEEEKVLVFGDSDTDGITSTALMTELLQDFGLEVFHKVPEGEEPYGLSVSAVDFAAENNMSLIVTVDCGISNHDEVAYAKRKGIDVIIADHHHLQAPVPPEAVAVLDPKLPDCGYPFRDLSGCGVALKLAHALAIARLGIYKEPFALLYAGSLVSSDTAVELASAHGPGTAETTIGVVHPEEFQPPSYSSKQTIEAVRLDNLTETSRLEICSSSDGVFPADTLERLEKFLRGRVIIAWKKKEIQSFFKKHFGNAAELDVMDLSQLSTGFWPAMAASPSASLIQTSRLKKYASRPHSAIDTLNGIFNAYILQLLQRQNLLTDRMFQLAALGTIADLMPLKDENRIIVRKGVESINASPSSGIRELKSGLGLAKPLGAIEIAWQITPTINAAGRLGTPKLALDLLQAKTVESAIGAASALIQANTERRRLGTEAWENIRETLNQSLEKSNGKYAVVGSSEIKPGITGLLASKAANIMKVPVIVAVFKADGTCTGSVRGGANFPLTRLLAHCADLFLDYGGHDSAAGFTLKTERWHNFLERLSEFMAQTEYNAEEPELGIDAELPHAYVTPELINLCRLFEPFGEENDPLVFCSKQVRMIDAQVVGKNGKNHLKLTLDFGTYKWPAMLWDGAERLERDFSFRKGDRVDILYKVTMNYWNGEERPQLELYDIRRAES